VQELDRGALYWISGWPDWLAPIMVFFSTATNHLWVKALLASIVLTFLIRGERTRRAAVFALLAFLLANEMTDVLKDLAPANRPYHDGLRGLNNHLVGESRNPGTASAHSANMAAIALAFTYYLGRWGWPWIGVAVLTGISRVYVGSHYPWQVLLGWTCGIVAALVLIKTWEAYKRWRTPAEDEDEVPEAASP
jgi:undecaprenyl-diphosphatase